MITTHIRRVLLGLALVVLGPALTSLEASAQSAQQPEVDALASYVCRVACDDGGGMTSFGTGTLVFSRSPYRAVVLTNAHVVRDLRGACTVTFADGEQLAARILVANEAIDAATLEIPYTGRQAATWRDQVGEGPLHGYGFGSGQLARLDGTATGTRGGSKTSVLFSSQFRNGDSGGPVFDDAGVLCGLIWATSDDGGLFVHPSHLAAFLEPLLHVGDVEPTQYSSCGPGGCPPQYSSGPQYSSCGPGGCPPGVIYGQPLMPNMPRIVRPMQPQGVPINATPITAPPAGSVAQPSTPPAAGCTCAPKWAALDTRLAGIDTRLAELAAAKATPGPAGPPGPAGKDGASIDADALATQVAALVMKQLPLASPAVTSSGVSHYVLVADQGAEYWPRLADEMRRARESYSGLRVSGVPDVPVGPLPQLVAYRDGKPMGAFRGRRDVSDALVRIAGGKAPLP